MRILLTGGTGFIGAKLAESFADSGHDVIVLSRTTAPKQTGRISFIPADLMQAPVPRGIFPVDAVVHLAGAPLMGQRWSDDYKRLILDSRVQSTAAIVDAIKRSDPRPRVFVCASAIGYYGEGGEKELDESFPPGRDFLAEVCNRWESAAETAQSLGVRVATIRTGVVLGRGGGALKMLLPLFKLGLGGYPGSGSQWFSWIALSDLIAVYRTAVLDARLSGPVNAVSPAPVRYREFARLLGDALHRPAIFPIPYLTLRIALGEVAGSMAMSQKVLPRKLQSLGFIVERSRIALAIADCI